jgi:hypothetical protein
MKTIILSILFFCNLILPAQNYENICSPGSTLFKDNNLKLKAFRRDSIHIPVSGDTIFISYRTIRDTTGTYFLYCLDTTNGSVLGRKIYRKSDGWFYFFNRHNDTVKINSQAAVNTSWKFCLLPAGAYIQATVTSIVTKQVLGINDLVKIITFQAKNSTNNNITHLLNGKTMELSQHFGLTKTLEMYYVPDVDTFYYLAGISNLALGIQPISAKEIYNFDTGDVFHYHIYNYLPPQGQYTEDKINHITGKTVYGNFDSVSYQVETCGRSISYPPYDYEIYHVTITVNYNFLQLSEIPVYSMLPNEFKRSPSGYSSSPAASLYYSNIASFNQRPTKGYNNHLYEFTAGCWKNYSYLMDSIAEYSDGLGQTYYHYSGPEGPDYNTSLVYFKKGSESWGTPVATDCYALVGIDDNPKPTTPSIRIIPNPVEKGAGIYLAGFDNPGNLTYILSNIYGYEIFRNNINSNPFHLDRAGIQGGCYILSIRDKAGKTVGRTKIIFY